MTYEPLPSVWYKSDAALLEQLLSFYPRTPPRLISDATVNQGRFWEGVSIYPFQTKLPTPKNPSPRLITLDIDPQVKPDLVADNRRMPFKDKCFDVVVYDPPHIPNQGNDNRKDFNTRFGLTLKSGPENRHNLSFLFPPFLHEAYRVLVPEGILLAKIADYVHNHRFQWAHLDLVRDALAVGFTACDCIVKVRKGPIVDPRWKKAHHARRHHCYWLIFRKSKKCE